MALESSILPLPRPSLFLTPSSGNHRDLLSALEIRFVFFLQFHVNQIIQYTVSLGSKLVDSTTIRYNIYLKKELCLDQTCIGIVIIP
jgi:hypothetical protein